MPLPIELENRLKQIAAGEVTDLAAIRLTLGEVKQSRNADAIANGRQWSLIRAAETKLLGYDPGCL